MDIRLEKRVDEPLLVEGDGSGAWGDIEQSKVVGGVISWYTISLNVKGQLRMTRFVSI